MEVAIMVLMVMCRALEVQQRMFCLFAIGNPQPCARKRQRLPAHAEHQEEGGKPTAHGQEV
ncbi:hypothetical protein [Delftia acidovorans]|uniref:Uncharacterized protein n=1 Tax=Delftia acidovorans TaxID=80866 RepID=A0AAJ2R2R7_DELAC|nr:hypothetical protein [Delftia acidovorans]MDX4954731.1 hypothetical protein [Delftia acidovorans]